MCMLLDLDVVSSDDACSIREFINRINIPQRSNLLLRPIGAACGITVDVKASVEQSQRVATIVFQLSNMGCAEENLK